MIRTCKGKKERRTQTGRSETVKSERVNYDEENENGDESDGRDSSDDTMKSNACVGRTNFMTDFYRRPTAIPTATIIKTRMVVLRPAGVRISDFEVSQKNKRAANILKDIRNRRLDGRYEMRA